MKDFFKDLSKSLDQCEKSLFVRKCYLWQVSDKISWCWRWKKITAEQKDILCDRVIKIYEEMEV